MTIKKNVIKLNFLLILIVLSLINLVSGLTINVTSGNTYTNVTNSLNFSTNHLNVSDLFVKLYLPFDYQTGNKSDDFSNYNNNANLNNNPTFTNGTIGGGYLLNGINQTIRVPFSSSINITNNLTISLWINQLASGTPEEIISQWNQTGTTGWRIIRQLASTYRFEWEGNDGVSHNINSAGSNTTGWHNIVVTFQAGSQIIYFDGVQVDSFTNPRPLANRSWDLVIGSSVQSTEDFFNGTIDEVTIFNKFLNASDVLQLKNLVYPKYYKTGSVNYNNLSLGSSSNLINVSIGDCQKYLNSEIKFRVNNGNITNLTNCALTNYSISQSSFANLTLFLFSNNSYYSPLLINNITILGYSSNDVIAPNGTIITPINATYTNATSLNFTLNATDNLNLSNAGIYVFNSSGFLINQTNITITGTQSTPSIVLNNFVEGIFNFFFRITDTAGNVLNTVTNFFTIDLTQPFIQILNPINTYYNTPINQFNFSTQDSSMSVCIFNNLSTSTTINCFANYSTNSHEGNNTWRLFANDTAGNQNTKEVNFTVDTIKPSIFYIVPTLPNNTYVSHNFISVNVNVSDVNFKNMSFILSNDSGLIQRNDFSVITNNVNFITLSDGIYYFNVETNDLAGNTKSTPTFKIILDTTKPFVNIDYPLNESRFNTNVSTLNYSASDLYPNLCYYSINGINSSTTLYNNNFTGITSLEGNNSWTVYCNDLAGNTNSSVITFTKNTVIPLITILQPLGDSEIVNETMILVVDANDSNGISSVYANITLPDLTTRTIELDGSLESDNFSVSYNWVVENISVNPNQTCIANISNGIAYNSISGNGSSNPDTLCSFIGNKSLFGDFDINITFNITNESGLDYALNFQVLGEIKSSYYAPKLFFIGITNFSREGRQYQVFASDGNFSNYLNRVDTDDKVGKLRITRVGDVFSAYKFNGGGWDLLGSQSLNLHEGVFISFETESAINNYGNVSVQWSDFQVSQTNLFYVGQFEETQQIGAYHINFSVNDTYNNFNSVEGFFSVGIKNYAPSFPFIIQPFIDELVKGNLNILWIPSIDANNDFLQYNISLFNNDSTFNQSIVTNYGNSTTNNYVWNSSIVQDGYYRIGVRVFEKLTAEHYTIIDISQPFQVNNEAPIVNFVNPTETNGSVYGRTNIRVNVTSSDLALKNITIILSNSTGIISSVSSNSTPFFNQFNNLTNGKYFFKAYSCDLVDNCADSVTRTINISMGLFGKVNLTLNVNQYPYVDSNTTYPVQARFFTDSGQTITNGLVRLYINEPNGVNDTVGMNYNSTTGLYETALIFNYNGDYPFILSGISNDYGSRNESGTFKVRSAYNITVKLFDASGNDIIDNYGFITAEYKTVQTSQPFLENFIHPLTPNSLYAKTFHAPYINGQAVLTLYEPSSDYIFRYINGQITFPSQYSQPNITKTYGENVYLSTEKLNGTDLTLQYVLQNKDLHPYFALFNYALIIGLILVVAISMILFFMFPNAPLFALIFAIIFAGGLIIIRVAFWFYIG